ncbi:MAG: DEAD/DEAH box helicase [Chloroflexi bacterium]|nr:DEAD/DEAH box helicase [Chloroflexota bacterium]
MLSDLMLICRECGKEFSFTASQQAAHARRGFTNQPTHCPDCWANRRAARTVTRSATSNASNEERRQTYPTVCAICGVHTTLPFKPSHDRPGYCLSCFRSRPQRAQSADTDKAVNEPTGENAADTFDAAAAFSGLTLQDTTRRAIASMGISAPTPIQEATIPVLLAGRDVIGQARTGSGKTLAFAIPMVERCDPSIRGVQALVLVPTRELAIQVASVTEVLAAQRRLKVTLLYGGRSLEPERRALAGNAQVVIGTPGRTLDHLRQGNLSLRGLRMFVLDEADEMLDQGFAHDVEAILSQAPAKRQMALFSATMPDWVMKTAGQQLHDPETVQIDAQMHAPPEIKHVIYDIDKSDKLDALRTLLDQRSGGSVLVFGRTKHGVKKLAIQLSDLGYPVAALQGNLSQGARERVMQGFRSGDLPILVATNVAARGLDVQGIEQVINYDLPDSGQLFTHRVGRTGRMGRQGEAITFITAEDASKWREIGRTLGRLFTRQPWPGGKQTSTFSTVDGTRAARQSQPRNPATPAPRMRKPSRNTPIRHPNR